MGPVKVALILLSCCVLTATAKKYEPTWESIDSRPLPSWYDEAKIGIFMHWGVYSVPSFHNEWFWYRWATGEADYVEFMKKNYKPDFTYADFAADFTAEFFDPNAWADLLKASGAKYYIVTSKHHEGFCNWNTSVSFNWNSVAVGPKRDLMGELAAAIRSRTDVKFGVYHSLFEWFNPLYLQDVANNFQTNRFVVEKTLPELYELVTMYKPEVIWSDGDFHEPSWYWNSTVFLAWLYNESPVKDTIVVNDRWGTDALCKHGGYYTCSDRYNPKTLQKHKWENDMTLDKSSWGYRREMTLEQTLTIQELLTTLAETVSCGGNMVINIGPTKEGTIIPLFEERLRQFGAWLQVNGEAIYSSKPWTSQNDTTTPGVWYTSKSDAVYATVLNWPSTNTLTLGSYVSTSSTKVSMLGLSGNLKWQKNKTKGIDVQFPLVAPTALPSQYAWVLKLQN